MPKPCTLCQSIYHQQISCFQRPKKQPKRTPIKKGGKHEQAWRLFRKRYLELHPSNHEGYYICYICSKWVEAQDITLDHKVSRSNAPELRYNEDNIEFCCWSCNSKKGSLSLEQYRKKRSIQK